MPPIGKVAPSRAGKRQVTCYVDTPTLEAVKRAANARRETLQQALAKAINDELGRVGAALVITCDRKHLFVRLKRPAQPRHKDGIPPSRLGRRVIAGWYDRIEVDAAGEFATEIGSSLQEIASNGLARMATRAPAAPEPRVDPVVAADGGATAPVAAA